MKIIENNGKCGKMITYDKFYQKTPNFPIKFCLGGWDFVKNFVPGVAFMNKKFSDPRVSCGGGGGDCYQSTEGGTCIISSLHNKYSKYLIGPGYFRALFQYE